MNLSEYKDLAINTMKEMDYSEQQLHLVLGIVGEFLSEVAPILAGGTINKKELTEELGDVMWYVACYAHINEIHLRPYPSPPNDSVGKIIGDLAENTKKEWVYGKEFTHSNKEKYIQSIVFWIVHICNQFAIEFSELLALNIEKLATRFPDKFNETDAINKDVETEGKIFNLNNKQDGTNEETEESSGEGEEGAGEE